jgi:flavin reductase (DIM6/NTAB) family NADH-FMN oxidoreductase RutF
MAKVEVRYDQFLRETVQAIAKPGALLVSVSNEGKPNVMTIGWGAVGTIWGKPIFIVLVRPSRFTYELMAQARDFTVNIPYADLKETVAYCGQVSGAEHDKFAERNIHPLEAESVRSPIIAECGLHYECRVVHTNHVLREELTDEITIGAYPKGDFHRIYYGEILSVQADVDFAARFAAGCELPGA